MVMGVRLVSPAVLIVKLPSTPFETCRPNTERVIAARSPGRDATACRATSIACAPYAAYGFGVAPIDLPKLFTNVAPAPVRADGGSPATLMKAPLPTAPFAFGS